MTVKEADKDIKVTFDTRNTKRKSDDKIVSVRYIGYVFNVRNA